MRGGGFLAILRHRSVMAGVILIGALVGLSVYAVIAIPYGHAIKLWQGGQGVWDDNPKSAAPAWVNFFSVRKLPETIIVDTTNGASKTAQGLGSDVSVINISLPFNYNYDDFPSEIALVSDATFRASRPQASISWLTPDGRQISLGQRNLAASDRYEISQDQQLLKELGSRTVESGLFSGQSNGQTSMDKGRYTLSLQVTTFEPGSDVDAKLVVYGKVQGAAGTDDHRRDLAVALLWGAPIALAFGLLGAVGSTVITLIIAAAGAWYAGWADATIQRLTELNAILPALPILILVATFYSRSLVVMLGVIVALGIFSLGIKVYRSIFLQMRSSAYIEAARAYGASDGRIIFRYLIPKALPVLIPQFVLLIPSMVFLEATLAILGLGDPTLPTWGKVLNDAFESGALYKGYYYAVLLPSLLLVLTGLGFALLGYGLDHIFNPRLRRE